MDDGMDEETKSKQTGRSVALYVYLTSDIDISIFAGFDQRGASDWPSCESL